MTIYDFFFLKKIFTFTSILYWFRIVKKFKLSEKYENMIVKDLKRKARKNCNRYKTY